MQAACKDEKMRRETGILGAFLFFWARILGLYCNTTGFCGFMRFIDYIIALQLLKYADDFIIMVFVKLPVKRDVLTRRRQDIMKNKELRLKALRKKGSVSH